MGVERKEKSLFFNKVHDNFGDHSSILMYCTEHSMAVCDDRLYLQCSQRDPTCHSHLWSWIGISVSSM